MASTPRPKKSRRRWIMLGLLGMIILCICGVISIALFAPDTDEVVKDESLTSQAVSALTLESIPAESDVPEGLGATPIEQPTSTSEPTSTPKPTNTPQPIGLSREGPAPIGREVITEYQILKVEELIRPADTEIAQANMFNDEPEPGNEFAMVRITIQCTQPQSDKCNVYLTDYNLSGSTGLIREPEWLIAGIPHMLESTEMFGGATLSGWIVFEVGQDETDLILAWEPTFSLSKAYMSLPDKE